MNTTENTNTTAALTYDPKNERPTVDVIRTLVTNGETYTSIAKRIEGLNATDVRHLHDYGTCVARQRNRSAAREFRNGAGA